MCCFLRGTDEKVKWGENVPENKLLNCCDGENKLIFISISFWCEVVAMVAILNFGFSLEFLC